MAASTSESTPLLGDTSQDIENNDTAINTSTENEEETPLPASAHFQRPRKILSIIILSCSLIAGILLIALHVLIRNGQFDYYFWNELEAVDALGMLILIAVIFAPINLKWNFPVFLNILLDLFFSIFILPWAVNMIGSWPTDNWCLKRDPYGKPASDRGPACHAKLLAVEILVGIAAGLGLVIGLSHLALFVLRTIALFRTRFWTRPMPIPTGSITLEISVKLRGPDGREVQPTMRT